MTTPIPLAPNISLHWLAVRGVQPSIPENPVVLSEKSLKQLKGLPMEFQVRFSSLFF
jgi:hypothetical protein